MFGTNEIVGQKYFKNAPKDSLFVTSMFFTLQGEGPYAGMPALFIRLTKCNLNCSFCDTFFDDGDWLTFQEIEAKIYHTICDYWNKQGKQVPEWILPKEGVNRVGPYNCVLVVTGGEPLLQKNLMDFLNHAKPLFRAMQIESNGTVNQDVPEHVTLVCSPKCSEKNGVAIKYLAPTELILKRADCLKFVMSSPNVTLDKESPLGQVSDMFSRAEGGVSKNPYSEVPDWAHEWKAATGKEIYVSPMNVYNTFPQKIKILHAESGGITMDQRSTVDEVISFWEPGLLNLADNQTNHEYTAKYCMEHGFRLNLQMHLYASLA
jgi:organic radical activating enzyme